jgi:hypothetical protein
MDVHHYPDTYSIERAEVSITNGGNWRVDLYARMDPDSHIPQKHERVYVSSGILPPGTTIEEVANYVTHLHAAWTLRLYSRANRLMYACRRAGCVLDVLDTATAERPWINSSSIYRNQSDLETVERIAAGFGVRA